MKKAIDVWEFVIGCFVALVNSVMISANVISEPLRIQSSGKQSRVEILPLCLAWQGLKSTTL